MSKRGWILFLDLSAFWGTPYLLIPIAVESIDPLVVAFGRTLVGTLILLPVALRQGQLRSVLGHWRWLLAFTLVEITGPWLLIGHAETRLNSSTTGLLIAMVPLLAAVSVSWLGHERLDRRRITGLVTGFVGVTAVVGLDIDLSDYAAAGALALASLGYAIGPIIIDGKLKDVPPLAVVAGSLLVATILYAPFVPMLWPAHVPAGPLASVAGLGVACTAIAFIIFFALILEGGGAAATLIPYRKPLAPTRP